MKKVSLVSLIFGTIIFSVAFIVKAQSSVKPSVVPATNSVKYDNQLQDRAEKWADSVMSTLSVRERVAQLFVPRLDITNNTAGFKTLERVVVNNKMGGFLLGKGTISSYADLINYGQEKADVPLMITLDGEWGLSMRVSGTPRFPYNVALGACADKDLLYEYGKEMARECKLMGIQVNFAPDIDVNSNPDNPVIGYRSFGENPDLVAQLGAAYSRGMWNGGVMPVGKHFPGHGDTSTDSHKTLPTINHTRQRLADVDLRPFELAFAEGMPGVMVAHLKVPSLDPTGTPASLSKKITTDFLQDSLGFKGLIFTDALAMKGASRVNENNCVSAFLAGADILLGSAAPSSDLDAVEDAVKSGKISQIELNRRCKKVLVYKYKLGLSTKPTKIESSVLSSKLHTPQVDKLLTNLSRKAITVVSDNARLLPIDKSKKVVVVSLGAPGSNKFSDLCKEYCGADRYGKLSATVLSEIKSAHVVIVGVFNSSVESKNALSTIVAANSSTVGVFFMNPYRVSKFSNLKSLSSIVLAYDDIPHLRTAAAEALAGKINVTGKLPINLPSVGKIGDGVVINKK